MMTEDEAAALGGREIQVEEADVEEAVVWDHETFGNNVYFTGKKPTDSQKSDIGEERFCLGQLTIKRPMSLLVSQHLTYDRQLYPKGIYALKHKVPVISFEQLDEWCTGKAAAAVAAVAVAAPAAAAPAAVAAVAAVAVAAVAAAATAAAAVAAVAAAAAAAVAVVAAAAAAANVAAADVAAAAAARNDDEEQL
jgi:hypothetical protein